MKRIVTITCLLFAFNSFAQRSSDFKVKLISPGNNQYIPVSSPFLLKANIINQGPDTLRMSDSVQLFIVWDGTPLTFTNGSQMLPYTIKQVYTIVPGDSATISFSMAFNNTMGSTSSFCVRAKPYNTTDAIADPDTADNEQCITLIHDVTDVPHLATQEITVYPMPAHDQLFISGYDHSGDAMLRITDVSGRLLHVQPLQAGQEKTSINISHLVPGQYFYQIINENKAISGRFMKE